MVVLDVLVDDEAQMPVRLELPILSLNPGLRHRCVALGVWPPGATDAVRVQGTHVIPLSPGASTAITELQFGGAPEAAPPPPSGHGRAGTTSVPRASAPPDASTAGPAPPWLVRQRRRAQPTCGRPAVPSRHHRAARCIGRRISGCLGLVRQLLTFVFSEQRDGSCSSSRRESDAARGVPSPAAHR